MAARFRILSLDGGGIRGIIPAQILVRLEEKLQKKTNNPTAKLSDFFDMITGTSTGGILACMYLAPRKEDATKSVYSANDVVNFYLKYGGEIFSIPTYHKIRTLSGLTDEKYPAHNLERILDMYFGKLELKDLVKPCLITAYDVFESKAHFFRQHQAKESEGRNFYVKDVARATSAAPTYFESPLITSKSGVKYPLIDGGVFANNPTLCAYAEARQVFKSEDGATISAKELIIFSLGNGGLTKMELDHNKVKNFGLIEWIRPLIDIMMSGVSQTVDYQLKQIYKTESVGSQYIRIEPELGHAKSDMGDASPRNLSALQEAGFRAAEKEENDDKLDRLAEMLISR
ncbi:MAG: patatin [Bacteroidetes bacterium]|nr:MAG: patatin [Bacteroidota bacterium]TAG86068.1 MAG: patatin [Bacteroidota bacterium]